MYKSCPKWLFWVYLDANKYFHSKSRPNFWCPKESLLGVKNYHFWEMTPRYPTLWIWCRKIVETSKACKMFLYFGLFWTFKYLCPMYVRKVANMSTFSILAQNVRMRLKEPLMYKSSRKWLCWVYWIQTNIFHPKSRLYYSGLQRFFSWGQKLPFLRNDPSLPYLMSLI